MTSSSVLGWGGGSCEVRCQEDSSSSPGQVGSCALG